MLSKPGVGAWIDMRRNREEAQAISDLHNRRILDLSVGASGDPFEKITVWPDGRGRYMPELLTAHVALRDHVRRAVNDNLEPLMPTMNLVSAMVGILAGD